MNFIEALLFNPLLKNALFAGLISSLLSGVIGSYVVVKRINFISGSISHSVLGGLGLFLYLNRVWQLPYTSPLLGALISAVFFALLIGWIQQYYKQREDAVIAMTWSLGMAIGYLFIAHTPGSNLELTNYLFGNLLWVSNEDLYQLLLLDGLVLGITLVLHKQLALLCFDEKQAALQGVKTQALYLVLLSLVAASIVMLMHIVGIILVMTLLTLPALCAGLFTQRLSHMMIFATLFAAFFSSSGLYISYEWDWPPGATIALLSALVYGLSLVLTKNQTQEVR